MCLSPGWHDSTLAALGLRRICQDIKSSRTCNRYMYNARIGAKFDQVRNNVPSSSPDTVRRVWSTGLIVMHMDIM